MRFKYVVRNLLIGYSSLLLRSIFIFVCRRVMIDTLGAEIVGLDALFKDILNFISMVDIGLSGAVGAALYKPICENDFEKIKGIVEYFKKLYRYIGIGFLVISTITTSFIGFIIPNSIFGTNINLYFALMAINIGITYFFSSRLVLIATDQKLFYLNGVSSIIRIITLIIQLIILPVYKSFLLYLSIDILSNLLNIFVLNLLVIRSYKSLEEVKPKLCEDTRKDILRCTKGLIFHKVGGFLVDGTNYIYTTIFAGFISTAIFSSYQLIIMTMRSIVETAFGSINSSIGNILASEKHDKQYELFKLIYLVTFWGVSLATILFINCSSAFIEMWLGSSYVVNNITLYIFAASFFFKAIRPATERFKSVAGLYYEDRYIPIIEGIINVVACSYLGYKYGMLGVVSGNLISTVCIVTWQKPYVVFKYIFKRSVKEYFTRFIFSLIVGFGSLIGASKICTLIDVQEAYLRFIVYGSITFVIVNLIYILAYYRTEEFKNIIVYMKLIKFDTKK